MIAPYVHVLATKLWRRKGALPYLLFIVFAYLLLTGSHVFNDTGINPVDIHIVRAAHSVEE